MSRSKGGVLARLALVAACVMVTFAALAARPASAAASPQTSEDDVEVHTLPPIETGKTVADLLKLAPFNDVAKKIELRVIYDDGGVVKTAEPTASAPGGGNFTTWTVERYAPGFVKETSGSGVSVTTRFDGEDLKKLLRTAAMPAGGGLTFKDKGGAVAVIVKKSAAGSIKPTLLEPVLLIATGAALGFLLGWILATRRFRAASP